MPLNTHGLGRIGYGWRSECQHADPPCIRPRRRLQQLVENGPHPPAGETGAKYIIREDGTRLDLRFLKRDADRCAPIHAHLPAARTLLKHPVCCTDSRCSEKRLVGYLSQ